LPAEKIKNLGAAKIMGVVCVYEYWIAEPNLEAGQKIGVRYRLSPYKRGLWKLEMNHGLGKGWELARVREEEELREYMQYREDMGWFTKVESEK
jgi:hypothetical protein